MKNIREYEFWDNDFFGLAASEKTTDRTLFLGIIMMVSSFFSWMIIGSVLELGFGFPTAFSMITGAVVGIVIGFIIPRMSKVYIGHGMPIRRYSGENDYSLDFRTREYLSLPKEDRTLYPKDILSVVRNPDLSHAQLADINEHMLAVFNDIQARNRVRAELTAKSIDISHVIDKMKSSSEHMAIEAQTYKEFM